MEQIIIAEDHSVLRMGVSMIIEEIYPDTRLLEAGTFYEALSLLREHTCELLILDIQLPGGGHPGMISAVRDIQPELRILIFSAFEEESHALTYIKAGANGYLSKTAAPEEVKEAVKCVLAGQTYMSGVVQSQLLNTIAWQRKSADDDNHTLSPREVQVMQLLVNGADNRDIRSALNIQASTLSTFKAKIFRKMQVKNLIELAQKVNGRDDHQKDRS